jgi:hypothetical protein
MKASARIRSHPTKRLAPTLKTIVVVGGVFLAFYLASAHYMLSVPYAALGIMDGLNICSITFMALIISLLYNLNTSQSTIRTLGLAYILGVSGTYLAIGVGILWFAVALPINTFTMISSIIMLIFGSINIVSYVQPRLAPPNPFNIISRKAVQRLRRLSFPSLIAAGTMIGLHNLPCCTGSIYLTSLAMIAQDPVASIPLISYNLGYVLPLASILFTCSSKSFAVRFRRGYAANTRRMKMILGIVMILISGIIIIMNY